MKYCTNCGTALPDEANFCSNCGTPVQAGEVTTLEIGDIFEPEDLNIGYRVVLFSRGSCTAAIAKEVLCDLLGYTPSTAKELLDNVPVEVADELNETQALVVAQALAEYGMDVTIINQNNKFVDFSSQAVNSVFDLSGALVSSALITMMTLTAANRVHSYRKYRKPTMMSMLFRPRIVRQPVHIRRNIWTDPESHRRIVIERPRHMQPRPLPRPKAVQMEKPVTKKRKPAAKTNPKETAEPAGSGRAQGRSAGKLITDNKDKK